MCIWCCLVYKQIKAWVASLPLLYHQFSTGLGSFPRKPMAQEAATCPPPSPTLQGLWLLSANSPNRGRFTPPGAPNMCLELRRTTSFLARSEGNQQPGAEFWETSVSGSSGCCGSWRKMDLGMRRGNRLRLED